MATEVRVLGVEGCFILVLAGFVVGCRLGVGIREGYSVPVSIV